MKKALLIIFSVLLIDQLVKIWIKTHMYMGQEFKVIGNWFIIHFTENNGMAFGMELGGDYGKVFLSVFRITAVIFGIWYLNNEIKKKAHPGFIVCVSLIIAGALGNIIDSAFYGMFFSESTYEIAKFMPADGGYAGFLHGKVVDMLYFPILEGHFPQWFPIWKGEEFIFFRPIFNIADAAISIGVAVIVLYQKRFFQESNSSSDEQTTTEITEIKSNEL